jgi:(1->4)-alpha-D-glucan 1-alpha-D-glucosylmutase
MNRVNGIFIDPAGEKPLTDLYTRFLGAGKPVEYPALVREKKLQVMNELLGSDVNRLTALFLQICERHRRYRDYTIDELRDVLCEVAACLPVYRTYVRAAESQVHRGYSIC